MSKTTLRAINAFNAKIVNTDRSHEAILKTLFDARQILDRARMKDETRQASLDHLYQHADQFWS